MLTNSGTIEATKANGIAIDFGNGVDTLKLVGNSRIIGAIDFKDGVDTLDFSEFDGSTVLKIIDAQTTTTVAGDRLFQWNAGTDEIAIIDTAAINGAPVANAMSNIATSIETIIAGQIGNPIDGSDNIALGYASKSQSPAEAAMDDAMADDIPSSEVWASVFGGFSQDSSPVKLDNRFGGLVAGSHAQFGTATIGALAGAAKSALDINSGAQTIDTTTGVIGVYGQNEMSGVNLNFSILAGSNKHDSARKVLNLGVDEIAAADFTSWFVSTTVGVEIPILTTENGEYNVATSLNYVGGEVDGYAETGSGLALTVGKTKIQLVELRVELNGQTEIGQTEYGAVVANTKIGIMGQSNLGGSTVAVSFFGGPSQNVVAASNSVYGLYLGGSIAAPVSDTVDVQFGMDFLGRSDGLNTLSGSAKLTAKF